MKPLYPVIIGSVLLTAGCASNEPPAELQSLKQQVTHMQQDPTVNQFAAVELDDAKKQVETAEKAWSSDDDAAYEHQRYLAETQLGLTRQRAELGSIEHQLKEAESRRSDLLLSARKQEVTEARSAAASAEEQLKAIQSEMQNVKAEQTRRGLVLTLQDVLFEVDKAQLQPGGRRTIQTLAEFLRDNPATNVTVEGFTDAQGTDQYNLALSQQRAQAVVDELTSAGIARERMAVKAYGEQYPVASNDSPSGRQQNRRVQMVLSDKGKGYLNPSQQ